jgi:rubrerythrin
MDIETCIADAFSGESQANRKYKSFSEAAADEGYNCVAKLFRATSAAEEIHARRLLRISGNIGATVANLQTSVSGELHETNEMYPSFIKVAEAKDRQDALITFEHAMKAEAVHANLYKQAFEAVKEGHDFEVKNIYLCPVCGNIEINEISDHCPICGVPGTSFKIVE